VLFTSPGIDGVDGFLAAFQALLNEGEQRAIGVLRAVEECANVGPMAEY
jgi:hypothetical protein